MGIFTRFKDIVSSNISSMLDKAEDPEKLIRLMIREMEETLVELKASCAGTMAEHKKIGREMAEVESRMAIWTDRAKLAVDKGREDLAREALQEKHRWQDRAETLGEELVHCETLVDQAQEDIGILEEKLATAKEKQRMLTQRHIRAATKKRAQKDIRRVDSMDAVTRFERFEQQIDRLEAEAQLVNPPRKSSLEQEFTNLEGNEDVERELQELKGSAERKAEK